MRQTGAGDVTRDGQLTLPGERQSMKRVVGLGFVVSCVLTLSLSATARGESTSDRRARRQPHVGSWDWECPCVSGVLQARLDEGGYDYEVINAGVSGDTTARALRRYREALRGDVKILIVALGANDGLRGVAVEQLKSNLRMIIEEAQRRGIAVVLLGMDALPMHGWAYSVAFHRAYDELAAQYRVTLVPFVLMKVMTDASLMQSDHAHPNADGARAIADLVWPHLQPLLMKE